MFSKWSRVFAFVCICIFPKLLSAFNMCMTLLFQSPNFCVFSPSANKTDLSFDNFESSQLAFPRFRAFLPPPSLFAPATGKSNRCKLFFLSPAPHFRVSSRVPLTHRLFTISRKWRACSQATLSPRSERLEQLELYGTFEQCRSLVTTIFGCKKRLIGLGNLHLLTGG